MQTEKMKKIGKWGIITVAIIGGLAILGFCGVFLFAALSRYGNNKYAHRDDFRPGMGGKNFFFDGKDCNEMVNYSESEIRNIIIEKYSGDEYYRDRVKGAREADLRSLSFHSNDSNSLELELKKELEKCVELENKIIKIFNDLQVKK